MTVKGLKLQKIGRPTGLHKHNFTLMAVSVKLIRWFAKTKSQCTHIHNANMQICSLSKHTAAKIFTH